MRSTRPGRSTFEVRLVEAGGRPRAGAASRARGPDRKGQSFRPRTGDDAFDAIGTSDLRAASGRSGGPRAGAASRAGGPDRKGQSLRPRTGEGAFDAVRTVERCRREGVPSARRSSHQAARRDLVCVQQAEAGPASCGLVSVLRAGATAGGRDEGANDAGAARWRLYSSGCRGPGLARFSGALRVSRRRTGVTGVTTRSFVR